MSIIFKVANLVPLASTDKEVDDQLVQEMLGRDLPLLEAADVLDRDGAHPLERHGPVDRGLLEERRQEVGVDVRLIEDDLGRLRAGRDRRARGGRRERAAGGRQRKAGRQLLVDVEPVLAVDSGEAVADRSQVGLGVAAPVEQRVQEHQLGALALEEEADQTGELGRRDPAVVLARQGLQL